MTEETKKTEQTQENMQPALMINSQYIKDLSLEIPHAPAIFKELTKQPQLKVDVRIDTDDLGDNAYNVSLSLALNGDLDTKKLFILELTYAAVVILNVQKEHIDPILNIEIPRLIYPFARNIIAQCLMEGGLPPLMLNPIDFGAIYAARQASKGKN